MRPPAQKAKSPAPQPPGGSSAPKLGAKGECPLWLCVRGAFMHAMQIVSVTQD